MMDILERHYGKLIAFLMGMGAEMLTDIGAWLQALGGK